MCYKVNVKVNSSMKRACFTYFFFADKITPITGFFHLPMLPPILTFPVIETLCLGYRYAFIIIDLPLQNCLHYLRTQKLVLIENELKNKSNRVFF